MKSFKQYITENVSDINNVFNLLTQSNNTNIKTEILRKDVSFNGVHRIIAKVPREFVSDMMGPQCKIMLVFTKNGKQFMVAESEYAWPMNIKTYSKTNQKKIKYNLLKGFIQKNGRYFMKHYSGLKYSYADAYMLMDAILSTEDDLFKDDLDSMPNGIERL